MKPIKLVLIWCSSCGRTRRRTVGKILTLRFKCLWLTVMVEDVDVALVADERNSQVVNGPDVSLNLKMIRILNRKRSRKRKHLENHLEDERRNRNQHEGVLVETPRRRPKTITGNN